MLRLPQLACRLALQAAGNMLRWPHLEALRRVLVAPLRHLGCTVVRDCAPCQDHCALSARAVPELCPSCAPEARTIQSQHHILPPFMRKTNVSLAAHRRLHTRTPHQHCRHECTHARARTSFADAFGCGPVVPPDLVAQAAPARVLLLPLDVVDPPRALSCARQLTKSTGRPLDVPCVP